MSRGTNYLGSESLQTSIANEEIIPLAPDEWTSERYKFIRFSFHNEQDCTVQVNNNTKIFLTAGKGFATDENIPPITSFKIVESGIQFYYAGVY